MQIDNKPKVFPVIHSISTVGIVMHYNQDYLLHPVRTDFTGKNGIGKSLIADLLQILFIAEKSEIKFGTDSFKKKEKQIHTLPYNLSEGYVFLNIEVAPSRFIIIGACISNKSTTPVKSFWVLNKAYSVISDKKPHNTDISDLSIPIEKIVYHQDFLKNGEIPSNKEMVTHFRDKKLSIKYFNDSTQRKEFYTFLFNKQILPINLTVKSHFNAFAKVIQAFSKANTLNTESDHSLKSFLFEDKTAIIEQEYNANRKALDKLIVSYNKLKTLKENLKAKRIDLEELEEIKKDLNEVEQIYSITDYLNLKAQTEEARKIYEEAKAQLKEEKGKIKTLKKQVPKLKKVADEKQEEHKTISSAVKNLYKYHAEYTPYKSLLEQSKKLSAITIPDLSEISFKKIALDDFNVSTLEKASKSLQLIFDKYDTLSNLQKEIVDTRKQVINDSIAELEELKQILSLKNEGSVFTKIINSKKTLTKPQETILFQLLKDLKIGKPDNPKNKIQFTDSLDILDLKNIVEDDKNNGYWFSTGKLTTFISYTDDPQLFSNSNKLEQLIGNKSKEITKKLQVLNKELTAIENFENDKDYDAKKINIKVSLDQDILNITKVNTYKNEAHILQNIDSKKNQYSEEINHKKSELDELAKLIPFKFNDSILSEIIDQKSILEEQLLEESNKSNGLWIKSKTNLEGKEEAFAKAKKTPSEKKQEFKDLKADLKDAEASLKLKYPETFSNLNPESYNIQNLEHLKSKKEALHIKYAGKYQGITSNYEEVKGNQEVIEQINSGHYTFTVLERMLLGKKIKETKHIEEALESANEERRKLAKSIHETMLKIFQKTRQEFRNYNKVISSLNTFFKGREISEKYFFQIEFNPIKQHKIEWIDELQAKAELAGNEDGLFEAESVETYVEKFFRVASKSRSTIKFKELLDPKKYFELETIFIDKDSGEKVKDPGSTGESYTAMVLLGIGRLSNVIDKHRKGLRFLILEEVSNLDSTNFKTFPSIAKDFDYQIITMTPKPFGSDSDEEWYMHQLLEGTPDKKINYSIPNSVFKTNTTNEQLSTYLQRMKN